MKKDISNETVFILAILTILISLLGVATMFFETSTMTQTTNDAPQIDSTTGTIKLEIQDGPQITSSAGQIQLEIKN
ncbi:MAG: hypothetical protein ACLFN8_02510 [Candidatus Woesearchaeota archaeon]